MGQLRALLRSLGEAGDGFRLPPLKVAAVLVLLMLGAGVLIGKAARTTVQDSLVASTRPHVKLLLPAHSTPSQPSSGTEAEASVPASEPVETPQAPAPSASTRRHRPPASSPTQPASATPTKPSAAPVPSVKPAHTLPAIKHVFMIVLSDEPYATVFGPESPARYLVGLEAKGALLGDYDAVGHEQLANEIALVSGQGPTAETAANCPTYSPIAPASVGAQEQVLGAGCVYPASTSTLPGQLSARHLSWRAYIEGMDEGGTGSAPCAHPVLGQPDPTVTAAGDYATFINPFVYFASLTASPSCAADDVGIDRLQADLANPKLTPSFSYIAPSRCDDGDPAPCQPGAPAGIAGAEAFLQRVVPEILSSRAYASSGLLVITVDEAPSSGASADSSSCCGEPTFPNLPPALAQTPSGRPRGGGAVGALLVSPFIKGPETNQEPFNHFSLLATIERIFGLKPLGYAGLPAVKQIPPTIFTTSKGS